MEGRKSCVGSLCITVGVRVYQRARVCDVCRGEGGARVIQRDRDGSTAPGSLELLMRSPPPLVFLGSVSVLPAFSPFPPSSRPTLLPRRLGFPSLPSTALSALAIR